MVRLRSISRSPSSLRRQPVPTSFDAQLKTFLASGTPSQLWWWSGGVGAFLLCLSFFLLYRQHQTTAALKSLHDGIAAMQNGKREEAIPLLERANAQIGSEASARGQLACWYLVEAYRQSGKLDEAKKLLEIQRYQNDDSAYLSQVLLVMAGSNAEKQNDLPSARRAYDEAVALDGPLVGEALLSLARVAEASGDSAAANGARDKFVTNFPNSPFASVVQQKLGK